jgi:hypothetical protein
MLAAHLSFNPSVLAQKFSVHSILDLPWNYFTIWLPSDIALIISGLTACIGANHCVS